MSKFKNSVFSSFFLLSLCFIVSCASDGVNEDECSQSTATGTINGKTFNFTEGRASEVSDGIAIRLFSDDVVITDICNFSSAFGEDAVSIFGTLPSATVGRTDLFLSASLSDGFTLTLFDAEGFSNIISSEGFIEITEVTDTNIVGFLKTQAGDDGSVCGTFDLTRC